MKGLDILGSRIEVTGHIHNITWKKSDFQSGDTAIFKFDCETIKGPLPDELEGKPIAFIGPAPSLDQSSEYTIVGELVHDTRWGFQYKIKMMTRAMAIESTSDARKFLEYILPPTTVENLFAMFENPIEILERGDAITLTRVKGIGAATARRILERYEENKIQSKAFISLYNYGLTKNMVNNLCKAYGSPETLVEIITENPYSLIYDVRGIGWKKADEIAKAMDIKGNDPRRVTAYIYFLLTRDSESNGNTYVMLDDLVNTVLQEVNTTADAVKTYILELIKKDKLFYEKATRRIGLKENRVMEEAIANELIRIYNAPLREIKGVEQVIANCERETGYVFSEEQRAAINNCLTQNVSILTALAGSGKTTSMLPVARAVRANQKLVALCALSGKASLNLEATTGVQGSTIHRLLGYDPEENEFKFNKERPLGYDMVILDEASMVDEYIFLSLLKAIPNGCKLVMVGDTGQLEPIGVGCVFHDIINSKRFPHVHLTKIFRQAQKSGVITESRKVYQGLPLVKTGHYGTEIRGELQDFKIITLNTPEEVLYNTIAEYKRFIKDCNATPDDIVIVTGKRVIGETSAKTLNNYIQKIVNPKPTPFDVKINKQDGNTQYEITFRTGDRIRVTRNCYTTVDSTGEENPVYNGNIGKIYYISPNFMWVDFPQGRIKILKENYNELELGYAITCHSAQGSGFPYVITVCDNGSYILLSKEWLYTAITRSKTYNTLIGQPGAINRACSINGIKYKQTWLQDILKDSSLKEIV